MIRKLRFTPIAQLSGGLMIPRTPNFSLRIRLLALGAVLVPLLAITLGACYAERRITAALDDVIRRSLDEMNLIMHFQKELLILGVGADDVLMHHPHETRLDFDAQIQRVDASLATLLSAAFDAVEEKRLVQDAAQEWRAAQRLILEVRKSPNAPTGPRDDTYMHRFNGHIHRAAGLLDKADELAHVGIERSKTEAAEVLRRMYLLVIGMTLAGMLMILAASAALTRVVLRPLRILQDGVRRIGAGQLSHRVKVARHDEIGWLAEAFNAMAEQIERDQTQLNEIAVHDSLTGLYNRREFELRLHEEIERAARYRHPLALLLLDIDHFKEINDRYGHQAGDEAMRTIADHLSDVVRPADHVARYGGDEFAILLPETNADSALTLAMRLCELIAAHSALLPQDQPITLTVSIGMAMYPDNAHDSDELVAAADQALYAAKAAGRNRVVHQTRTRWNTGVERGSRA